MVSGALVGFIASDAKPPLLIPRGGARDHDHDHDHAACVHDDVDNNDHDAHDDDHRRLERNDDDNSPEPHDDDYVRSPDSRATTTTTVCYSKPSGASRAVSP